MTVTPRLQVWHGHLARVPWAGRPCHGFLQGPLFSCPLPALASLASGFGVRRQAVSRATPLFRRKTFTKRRRGTPPGRADARPSRRSARRIMGWRASVPASRLPRRARKESGAATRAARGTKINHI